MSSFKWMTTIAIAVFQTFGAVAEDKKSIEKTLLTCDGLQYAMFIEKTAAEAGETQKMLIFCSAEAAASIEIEAESSEIKGDDTACKANLERPENQKCLALIKEKAEIDESTGVIAKPEELSKISSSADGLKTEDSSGDASTNQPEGPESSENGDDGKGDDSTGDSDKGKDQDSGDNSGDVDKTEPQTKNEKSQKCTKLESAPVKCEIGLAEQKKTILFEAVSCRVKEHYFGGYEHGREVWIEEEVEIPMFCQKKLFDDASKSIEDCRNDLSQETLRCRDQYLYGPEADMTQEYREQDLSDEFINRNYGGGFQWHEIGEGY